MKVRIEYTSPFAYLIVINGEKLWIKDGKKVTRINNGAGNPFSKINNVLLNTLQGNFENIKGFDANYLENKKQYLLELTPTETDTKKLFKKITVYLNHETLEILRMDMLEKSGDITKMVFTNTELNIPIADEVFVVR
jgi:outer membrane lipoprotein-sorting protein